MLLMALALFLAVMLNSKIPLRGFIRSAVYAPAVVSTVVVGTVFTWIFQDQLGLINYLPVSYTHLHTALHKVGSHCKKPIDFDEKLAK